MSNSFTYTAKQIIGKKIKFLREKKDMTQQELGELIGADRQYINKVEKGKKNITLDYLDKITKALNVTQDEFINTN